MRENITVALRRAIKTHDGLLKRIVMREPTFDEYMAVGDPYIVAESPGGTRFIHENMETIRQYLAICLVEPKDPALLMQCGANVAKEVKERLLSFFRPEADEQGEASGTSPTNSPSADTASGQSS